MSVRRPDAPQCTAHTLIVKDLGLGCLLRVDAVELEGEALALVLRVGDLDDGLCVGRLCPCAVCGVYNDVLINLCIEERANASDDADAHDCGVLVSVPAVSLAVSSPARRFGDMYWLCCCCRSRSLSWRGRCCGLVHTMVEVVKEGKQGIPLSVAYAVCVMPVESVCAVLELRQYRSSPLLARVDPGPNHTLPQQPSIFESLTMAVLEVILILITISIVMFHRLIYHDVRRLMVQCIEMVTCMK